MRTFALTALMLAACAHAPDTRELEARLAALEARVVEIQPAGPSFQFDDSRGVYLASLRRPNVEKSLFGAVYGRNCNGDPTAACSAASFTTTGTSTALTFTATVSGVAGAFIDANNDSKLALGSAGAGISGDATGAYVPNLGSSPGSFRPASSGSLGTSGSGWGALFLSAANGSNLISLADSTNSKTLKLRNNNDAFELYNNANAKTLKVAASGTVGGTLTGGTSLASLSIDDSVGAQLNYNGYTFTCATGQCGTGSGTPLAAGPNPGVAGSGTGFTSNANSYIVHKVDKITVDRTALTAAATTQDITFWTVPAKTRVLREIADVTQAFDDGAGPISAVTMTCGTTAGGSQYLNSGSVFAVTTLGDVAAEIGAGLLSATVADIPSFSTTTAVQCRFTSTGGNLSTLTTGSVTYYLELLVYP